VPDIILPIGISFFTFQQISLLVDAHKGRVGQLRFWDHVLFIRAPRLRRGDAPGHGDARFFQLA
jgi:hypothetical protein